MNEYKTHEDQKYIDGLLNNNSFIIQVIYDKFAPKIINYVKQNNGNLDNSQYIILEVLTIIYNQASQKKLQLNCSFDDYFLILCKLQWTKELKKTSSKALVISDEVAFNNNNAYQLAIESSSFGDNYVVSSKMFQKFDTFYCNLKSISNNYFVKLKRAKNLFKPWHLAAAASIAILLSIVLLDNFSIPDYKDYAMSEKINLTAHGNQDALLHTAENAFNTKDFKKADEAFKSLLVLDKENAELMLYRAISNIELNNFDTAEQLLMNLKKKQSIYKHKATWYLALSNLKQKEFDECLEILNTIPEEAVEYKKAQHLIHKLD